MSSPIFLPKIITCLKGYTRRQFSSDLSAGLTVGMVALPLALAFGIASIPESVAAEAGLSPPAMGLFTAIVAGILISLLGGTRTSIGGPTGAFIVIVYQIASQHGYAGLVISTILAGCFLIFFGVARLGGVIKFIPFPVTTGFTAGIAVIIFTGQIKDLLGLAPVGPTDSLPPDFIGKIAWYFSHASAIHWPTAITGVACIALIFLWPRIAPRRIPAPIVVLLGATLIAQLFKLPLETIADRFGAIPTGLPAPKLPSLAGVDIASLVPAALTIAILAAIESLLCAVVADGMTGSRHRSNTELIAQGCANIAAPIFGGIPATGAIARTATNIQSGGRTPIAGILHALTLLLIVLLVGRYAALVPLCVLSAVLVVVAWNMSERERFVWLLKGPRSDAAVLIATFALTVFTDLTIAVQTGMVLAAILFIKRMSEVTSIRSVSPQLIDSRTDTPLDELTHPDTHRDNGIEVYDINGPFFFGAAYKLRETLDSIAKPPRILILNLTNILSVDATGLHALEELRRRCRRDNTRLILAGAHAQPLAALAATGALSAFADHDLTGTVEEALAEARRPLRDESPSANAP